MNLSYKSQVLARAVHDANIGTGAAANSPGLSVNAARQAVEAYRQKRNLHAVLLLVSDYVAFAAGQYLVIATENGWLKALGAVITWVSIVRLFLIGHDACHEALVSSKLANQWMARVAFLVSLTPYSTWRAGHNIVHHGFNNLRGRDFVWEPKTLAEYGALPRWRQRLERLYRSVAGPPLYYLVEIWWRCLFFPGPSQARPRTEFKLDSMLVTGVAALWTGLIALYTVTHGTAFWPTLLLAFIVPFLLWNWSVGLVVLPAPHEPRRPLVRGQAPVETGDCATCIDDSPGPAVAIRAAHPPHHGTSRAPPGRDDTALPPQEGPEAPAGDRRRLRQHAVHAALLLALRARLPAL